MSCILYKNKKLFLYVQMNIKIHSWGNCVFSSLFSFQQNLHLADASRSSKYSLVCDAQQVEVIFYLKILLLITRKKIRPSGHFQAFGTQILSCRIFWCLPCLVQGT